MNVSTINKKGTRHFKKELSQHLREESVRGVYINFHQDLFITKRNKRFLLTEEDQDGPGGAKEAPDKNSWVDFDYIQNEIDNYLQREENAEEIKGLKHIILFVHKEIRFQDKFREASYKAEGGWDYQVVENLNSLRQSRDSQEHHVAMIGKTCENILENISLEHNHDLFFSLFFKALENFVLSKEEFHYIRRVLIDDIDQFNEETFIRTSTGETHQTAAAWRCSRASTTSSPSSCCE